MHLSRFTDYAIRVLFYVAAHPDRLVTLNEIADFYQISLDHLRKIVHRLSKSSYLKTYRGHGGGMQLNQSPEEINIGKLIAELEGSGPLIDCAGLGCAVLPACGLPAVLKKAQQAFYNELGQYSLADVIKSRQLNNLLSKAHAE